MSKKSINVLTYHRHKLLDFKIFIVSLGGTIDPNTKLRKTSRGGEVTL